MNSQKSILIALLLVVCGCKNNVDQDQPPYHSAEELGTPVEFAKGDIRTMNGISFSSDGKTLYTSKLIEKSFRNGSPFAGIFRSDFEGGKWSKPELVDFGKEIDAYHPVLSTDNQLMLFNSRSHPDTLDLSIPHNIWYSRKTEGGWSLPEMIPEINSSSYDSYPSISKNENIYFNSDRPGGKGGMDIYLAEFSDGRYQEPVNMEPLNSSDSENDLVVDPQERFIIFNRYFDTTNELDLYISFKEDNRWTEPIPLDVLNKKDAWELTPTLSPDGNYFFFELNSTIMQYDLGKLLQSD